MKKFTFKGVFSALLLFNAVAGFSQQDGDLRTRVNNAGWAAAATWQKYSSATGAWTTSDVAPTATSNVLIRDGVAQTSNGTGYTAGSLTVGEGNAAVATAIITDGVVTAVTITDPGKLIVVPPVTFVGGPATTAATGSVTAVKVTGTSFNDQGSGYTTAEVAFAAAPAGGTTATGTAVITGGKITDITVTNPGSGYTAVPAITITGDGTGASYSSLVGVETVNITAGGAGYTTAPRVVLGSAIYAGNASTTRTLTIVGDVTFRKGATIISGGTGNTNSTLVIGGNLTSVDPQVFFNRFATTTGATTASFSKEGIATITGPAFTFRNVTVGATTVLAPASDMNIAGTINFNTTGQIDASNGNIGFLNYNTTPIAQTVAATTFKDGLIRNLIIGNNMGVILNQNITVSNILRLDSGVLTIPSTGTLQLNATNPIAGTFGTTSHINTMPDAGTGAMGMVQVNNISTSRTIPLGNAGNYLPVTINPSAVSTFTTSVFTGATENGTPNGTATPNKNNIVDAIFVVNRTAGSGNTTLTLGFPGSLKGTGFTGVQNNQLGISRYSGSVWETVTGNGDNTQNFATAVFSTFSPFRVEFNALPVAFPVKLGDVTATKVNDQVVLNWKVYNETNVSKYVIERSVDGVVFMPIGFVNASGNTSYSTIDPRPSTGKNLYRLRSVDRDNSYSLSRILLIDFGKIRAALSVTPNPVRSNFFTVQFGNMRAGKVALRMFNNIGQLTLNQVLDHNGTNDNQLINLPSGTAKGVYQLVLTDGLNTQKASVVIQ